MSVTCSIIIPHFNQVEHLSNCLLALSKMTQQALVIVVDNGTPDIDPATYKVLYPGLNWIIHTEVKNPYTLRNLGIAAANSEYLLFMDAKCQPQSDWLTAMLEAGRQTDIVAGRYKLSYQSETLEDMVHGLLYLNNQKNVREDYGVSAGNLLVKKSVFQKVGMFDDSHVSGRDILWSKAALSQGYKISYAHDAIITYPALAWQELLQKVSKYGKGAAEQGVQKNWTGILPLRISTYREALKYRGLEGLSLMKKLRLYLYAWKIKRKYNDAID